MLIETRIAELPPLWEQFMRDKLGVLDDMGPGNVFRPDYVTSRLPPEIRNDPRHQAMQAMTVSETRSLPDLEYLRKMDIVWEYYGLFLTVADHVKIMTQLLAWIEGDEVVVDVGSGPCSYLSFLILQGVIAPRCAVGIDPCDGAMKRGRELTAELGVSIKLCQALAQNLPLPDEFADLVISIDTLHWSHQWRRGLRQIARITKPQGRVFITHTTGCPRTAGEMTAAEVIGELARAGISVDGYEDFVSGDSLTQRSVIKGTKGKPSTILRAGTIG